MFIVTGGAGFIGSNLVRGLNAQGITDITIVDDLELGAKHRNLDGLAFRDYLDFRDFRTRLASLGRMTAIFHQGACSDTMNGDGRYMMDNNYEFSKELLAWAMSYQAPFIYASSASVYGDGGSGFREQPACEKPLNVYAFSKHTFDRWVRHELPKAQSQILGLRYFNVYGWGEAHKGRMASVAYHFHHQAKQDGVLKLFAGSQDFRRDFIWVDDVVKVNLFALANPRLSGIYNCGSGHARSFQELAQVVASQRPGTTIDQVPFPAALQGKYQAFTQADLKALRAAGYSAEFTSLENGIAAYLHQLASSDAHA
jgi:ADP-L-glycero-D-manno-heptose 6-epimerase